MPTSKYYLSGADWIVSALDYSLKKTTNAGNIAQVVFMLNFAVKEVEVRESLKMFLKEFPLLQGSISRDFNLAPYWKIPKTLSNKNYSDLNFTVYHIANHSSHRDLMAILEKSINEPFKSDNEHLAFHLVYIGERESCMAMTFDHSMFDAHGAEEFLDLFQQYLAEGSRIVDKIHMSAPAGLSQWGRKFRSGKNVNRQLIALSKNTTGALPVPPLETKRGFTFRVLSFNKQESEKIYDNAHNKAGYFMETPYLLAITVQKIHMLFKKKGIQSCNYLVPMTVDMRSPDKDVHKLFFNHVSYLFFILKGDDNLDQLIMSIKQQMYDQIKAGLPGDLFEASMLARIAPLAVLRKIMDLLFRKKTFSFIFSNTGKSPYQYSEFMGAGVKNIFPMPRVPVPPGLGIFFNVFNGRFNAVISCLDGLIEEQEITELEEGLKDGVLNVSDV